MFDPALQTGPLVIFPIAFTFKLFGIGLFQARFVTSLLSLLCLFVYYRLTLVLYGRLAAIFATTLLLFFAAGNEFVSFLFLGRQVLGETAALFFFLAGLLLWFKSWEHKSWKVLTGAGLLFGAAMITKSQFNLLTPLIIFLSWLFGFLFLKLLRWRDLLIPAVLCAALMLGWYTYQIVNVGSHQFFLNAAVLRAGMKLHVLDPFSLPKMRTALSTLWQAGYVFWGGSGLLYAFWSIGLPMPPLMRLQRATLLISLTVWLGWYVGASIGWARYAFVAVALSHILYAALLSDIVTNRAVFFRTRVLSPRLKFAITGPFLLIALWMVVSSYPLVFQILSNRNQSYFGFACYLNETIPPGTVVESWEWELDLITQVNYHHPPTSVTNAATDSLWTRDPNSKPVLDYEFRHSKPEYVIIGPFARWTGLYNSIILSSESKFQAAIGEYELYRVTPPEER